MNTLRRAIAGALALSLVTIPTPIFSTCAATPTPLTVEAMEPAAAWSLHALTRVQLVYAEHRMAAQMVYLFIGSVVLSAWLHHTHGWMPFLSAMAAALAPMSNPSRLVMMAKEAGYTNLEIAFAANRNEMHVTRIKSGQRVGPFVQDDIADACRWLLDHRPLSEAPEAMRERAAGLVVAYNRLRRVHTTTRVAEIMNRLRQFVSGGSRVLITPSLLRAAECFLERMTIVIDEDACQKETSLAYALAKVFLNLYPENIANRSLTYGEIRHALGNTASDALQTFLRTLVTEDILAETTDGVSIYGLSLTLDKDKQRAHKLPDLFHRTMQQLINHRRIGVAA